MDFLRGIGEEKPIPEKKWALNKLREMDVETVRVYYSGGNDSGSVDDIGVFFKDGRTETWDLVTVNSHWDRNKGGWVYERELTDEEKLKEILCKPVYDQYGSFAGDFHVDGQIVWKVDEGKVEDEGEQEVRQSEGYLNNIYEEELEDE